MELDNELGSAVSGWIETARSLTANTDIPIPLINYEDLGDLSGYLLEIKFPLGSDDTGDDDHFFALLEGALLRDPSDTAVRFVALNAYYRLLNLEDSSHQTRGPLGQDHILERFSYLVRLRAPESCSDARSIRWEIVNACAVGDYQRAIRLTIQLQGLLPVQEMHAIRGCLHFLVAFAPWWPVEKLGLEFWDLPIGPSLSSAATRKLLEAAQREFREPESNGRLEDWERSTSFQIISEGLGWVDKGLYEFTIGEKDGLHDAIAAFNKAAEVGRLTPASRLMLARSYAVTGHGHNAALNYESMLGDLTEIVAWCKYEIPDFVTESYVASNLYSCLNKAFEEAGEIEKAKSAVERWIAAFPEKPGLHDKLAKLQWKIGDSEAAYESMRREVDRHPTYGEDPTVSMALAAWEIASPTRSDKLLKQLAAVNRPEQELVASVIEGYWPTFSGLTPDSKTEWAAGAWLLNTQTQTASPDATVGFVTRVVERELKTLIFERFKNSGTYRLATRPQPDKDEIFFKYLTTGRITLGPIFSILYEARRPSASLLIESLRRWLTRERCEIASRLAHIPTEKIVDFRNQTIHVIKRSTLEEANEVISLCKKVLDALYMP